MGLLRFAARPSFGALLWFRKVLAAAREASAAASRRIRPSHEPVAQPGPDASKADGLVTTADGGGDRVELGKLFGGEDDVGGRDVFLEIFASLRSGDREDVLALCEHPGERDLCGGRPAPERDVTHCRDDPLIFRNGVLVEAGQLRAKVVRAEAPI